MTREFTKDCGREADAPMCGNRHQLCDRCKNANAFGRGRMGKPPALESEHKTLPPDRDLAAELDMIAAEHAEFCMTVAPAMQEMRMLIDAQATKIAMLESKLFNLQMHTPVGIIN